LIASNRDGRYIVYTTPKKLLLLDTQTNEETDLSALSADLEDDGNPFGGHRVASFDRQGKKLLYLKKVKKKSSVVVYDLATKASTEIDPGAGNLWRAEFDESGEQVSIHIVDKDTNHDKVLSWPSPKTTLGARGCRGAISSYSTYGYSGDIPSTKVVAASGGTPREVKDLLFVFGDELILQNKAGAILSQTKDGATKEIAPASCQAVLHGYVPQKKIMAWSCAATPEKLELYQNAKQQTITLPKPTKPIPDGVDPIRGDILQLRSEEGEQMLIDLATGQLGAKPPDGFYMSISRGAWALFESHERRSLYFFYQIASKQKRTIPQETKSYGDEFLNGDFLYLEPVLIDLSDLTIVGETTRSIYAVATDGRVLMGPPPAPMTAIRSSDAPSGPVRWQEPQ
jgi:hypothetical protein